LPLPLKKVTRLHPGTGIGAYNSASIKPCLSDTVKMIKQKARGGFKDGSTAATTRNKPYETCQLPVWLQHVAKPSPNEGMLQG